MKIIRNLRIYYLVLIGLISLLLYDGYYNLKDEIVFTPKYTISDHSLQTKDNKILVFTDSIKAPRYINEYVGIMKNDTIVSYRRKLDFGIEFVYHFNGDKYENYRSGIDNDRIDGAHSQIKIENLDKKMMDRYSALFFIPLIFLVVLFLIVFFNSNLYETGAKYTFIYKTLYLILNFVFSILLLWFLSNIGIWMFLIPIFYLIGVACFYFGDDESILEDLTKYGYSKNLQNQKTKRLINNYNQLID